MWKADRGSAVDQIDRRFTDRAAGAACVSIMRNNGLFLSEPLASVLSLSSLSISHSRSLLYPSLPSISWSSSLSLLSPFLFLLFSLFFLLGCLSRYVSPLGEETL